jgi:hypothetical protein
MRRMRITVRESIKILLVLEGLILLASLVSFSFFINLQIAFLSSFFIMIGSMYGYKKMVQNKIDAGEYEEKRDFLDTIEDPHELYDETPLNDAPAEELDLKAIVREEKKKIKTFSLQSMKHGTKGSFSLFRVAGYIFLFLGFVALKNNDLLDLAIYMPSLLGGIVAAYFVGKNLFLSE